MSWWLSFYIAGFSGAVMQWYMTIWFHMSHNFYVVCYDVAYWRSGHGLICVKVCSQRGLSLSNWGKW